MTRENLYSGEWNAESNDPGTRRRVFWRPDNARIACAGGNFADHAAAMAEKMRGGPYQGDAREEIRRAGFWGFWKLAREKGAATVEKVSGSKVDMVRNNDELYARKDVDAVLIATADFQHARHGIEAVKAGRDAYVEKPTAHRMDDARDFLKAVEGSQQVIAVGTQRRSTPAYMKAAEQRSFRARMTTESDDNVTFVNFCCSHFIPADS